MIIPKTDISHRVDVESLVTSFYEKAVADSTIGHFFTQIVVLNLEEHLPKIVDFWCGLLLGHSTYKGNPMVKHIILNRMSPIKEAHFNRWLALWSLTVHQLFEGPLAEEAIKRAKQIADLMQHKIRMDQIN